MKEQNFSSPNILERIAGEYLQVTGHNQPGRMKKQLAYSNYKHNMEIEDRLMRESFPEKWITDQRKLSDLKFGIRDMAYAGCELIAVYNAIFHKRKQVPKLSELILQCELSGLDRFAGQWGTDVYRLGELLQANKLNYHVVRQAGELKMEGGNAYILSFWNSTSIFGGIHTVFFEVKNKNQIVGYNYFYSEKPNIITGTWEAIFQKRPFIVGYYL